MSRRRECVSVVVSRTWIVKIEFGEMMGRIGQHNIIMHAVVGRVLEKTAQTNMRKEGVKETYKTTNSHSSSSSLMYDPPSI